MKEIEVLEDMLKSNLKGEFIYTDNEVINQLGEITKVMDMKNKEIELKNKHIQELEYKVEDTLFKANMYKSMIQGIFDKI